MSNLDIAVHLSIPFISAAIGWVTNYIAIKMLFRPREEKRLLAIRVQGIFPKRKKLLAEKLGRVVARDLLSMDAIASKIDNEENKDKVKTAILTELEDYLVNKVKKTNAMIGMFMTEKVMEQIKTRISEQLDQMIPRLMGQFTDKLHAVDIEGIVYEKVSNFSNEKLENLLMSVIRKEFKFIEILGAVLGFMIGLLQSGLFLML